MVLYPDECVSLFSLLALPHAYHESQTYYGCLFLERYTVFSSRHSYRNTEGYFFTCLLNPDLTVQQKAYGMYLYDSNLDLKYLFKTIFVPINT